MVASFDFVTIDTMLNNVGLTIEGFITIVTLILNNILFLLMFCFFIAFIWATLKIFDLRRYHKNKDSDRGRKNW